MGLAADVLPRWLATARESAVAVAQAGLRAMVLLGPEEVGLSGWAGECAMEHFGELM